MQVMRAAGRRISHTSATKPHLTVHNGNGEETPCLRHSHSYEARAVSSERLAKSVGKHSRSAPPATPHDVFPGKWQCGKVAVSELDMLLGKAICKCSEYSYSDRASKIWALKM
jgi:hypothetical protein